MKSKQIYLGGDLLKKGSQLLREQEKKELEALGYNVYSPKDDKEINDKSNQTEESNNGLAEKIVLKDTKGIIESDIIVIEPTNDALGTCVELGQIKGMKDLANIIISFENEYWCDDDIPFILSDIINYCKAIANKKVYPHYEDIRRTDIPECADRRSWSVNQYVYGVCLDLTNGKGFYEWDEIKEELE